jgi:glycosyltransferase involved in cell wall biosynthesis
MRIGFLTSDLNHHHGWGRYSLNLIQALRAAGVDVAVVAARNSDLLDGVPVAPLLPAIYPKDSRMLLRMLAQAQSTYAFLNQCDIIHCTVEFYAPLAAWVAGKRPLFITGHGSYVQIAHERHWPVSALYRRAFYKAQVICVSHYTAQVAASVLPGLRTVVVNNGVDVARFAALAHHVVPRGAHDIASTMTQNKPVILAVGAVKARKGILELVQAIPAVRREIPEAECVVIGSLTMETAYVERVRTTIMELGLSDCVHLLGHVSEAALLEWYNRASVFAVPSLNDGWKFEGYGLVHLEASGAGLPVIGTTDCGIEDAIEDEGTGLLVSQTRIAEELPQAIIRILSDPDLAARMGAAGRAKAATQTWDRVAGQMINLYKKTLKS